VLWSWRRRYLHVLAVPPAKSQWQSRLVERGLAQLGLELDLAISGFVVFHHIPAGVLVVGHKVVREDLAKIAKLEQGLCSSLLQGDQLTVLADSDLEPRPGVSYGCEGILQISATVASAAGATLLAASSILAASALAAFTSSKLASSACLSASFCVG
jgi:hypothetical protein